MLIKDLITQSKTNGHKLLEVELILAYLLNKDRSYLLSHGEEDLPEATLERFNHLLAQRQEGVPFSYLTNLKEFYGRLFYVDERVLIPRPETESLIEVVKKKAKTGKFKSILDVGTGSGCIAISLAMELPKVSLTAVDISPEAIEVARINADYHKVTERITFLESDLLSQVEAKKFDCIVANLPYIGEEKYNMVHPESRLHEPNQALFSGVDGLDLYRRLFAQVWQLKHKPKFVIGEFGFGQTDDLKDAIFDSFPDAKIDICPDLAKVDRIFILDLSNFIA